MSNNVFTGPNAIVAKNTVDFVTAGLTALNTKKIFFVDANLKSYVPGRSINGISGFVAGKGYYLQALQDMDLSANVAPPLTGLTQLATPGSFTVTPGNTQNVLDWADVTNATSYTVDRATNVGFTTGVALNIYTGATSGYTDTGRTNGTQYFYRVRATAAGYLDSDYATGNGTPTSGVVTEDLVFNTTNGLSNSSGVWSGGNGGTWANFGVATKKIASGQNGGIIMQYGASNANDTVLGLNTSNTSEDFNGYECWLSFVAGGGGSLAINDSGVNDSYDEVAVVGTWYKMYRTGSVWKVAKSADGVTYTDLYTMNFTNTGDIFINANINGTSARMHHPKGVNVS